VSDTLVRMPKLADTLVEGTLGQWLKSVGEAVQRGEPLASIETDKVTAELTSPAAGTLLELLIDAGQTVPVETPIARIGTSQESAEVAPKAATKVTPLARRILEEHHLTPDAIPSRGARVTRQDVLAAIAQRTPVTEGVVPLSSMRRAIADHMSRARQTIPHGQTVMAADLTNLVAWRDRHKDAFARANGAGLTFTVLFVYALARQLESPAHVGVAVALDAGLIVPVLRNADALSLPDTARAIADLAERARSGKLTLEETLGATMTLTNVGSFGNLMAAPIIPLGQTGILGPGIVERRPLPSGDGGIRPGWQCLLSFVFDRRAYDDLAADRFLKRVVRALEGLAEGL
jgi:pyruvate/2-oxoglutarate dehydrogenase complex dihydrolipoamide acyltransferase (E2) component